MRWALFALFAILLAVEATTGYGNYYNNAPAGQYNKPSEWSPFDERHANEPRGDRSGSDNKGKIVVNGECQNCVTNRPIIGPDSQGYVHEQQGGQQGYGTRNTSPYPGYPQNAPQPSYTAPNGQFNNSPNWPSSGNVPNGDPRSAPSNFGNRPQQGYGNNAPNGQFNNSPNWPSSGNVPNGGPRSAPSNFGNRPQQGYGNNAPNGQFNNSPNFGNNLPFGQDRAQSTNGNTVKSDPHVEAVLAEAKNTVNRLKGAVNNQRAPPARQAASQAPNEKIFSGRLPDGTYVHNGPCTNCRIEN